MRKDLSLKKLFNARLSVNKKDRYVQVMGKINMTLNNDLTSELGISSLRTINYGSL